MEAINILLIGVGTGAIFAIVSILIINTSNSEQYPVGGFLPALWMVADFGESSKLVAAGLLMMGGITGFYLMLAFRKLRFETLRNKFQIQPEVKKVTEETTAEGEVPAEGATEGVEDAATTEESKDKTAKPSDDKTKDKSAKPTDDKVKVASGDKGKSINKEKETKKK